MNSKNTDTQASNHQRTEKAKTGHINGRVISEHYHVIDKCLTICVLKIENGHYVTGESAPASLENYDAEFGRKLAREAAVRKIWSLEGYLLREKIYQDSL